jgi:hypothetical protein
MNSLDDNTAPSAEARGKKRNRAVMLPGLNDKKRKGIKAKSKNRKEATAIEKAISMNPDALEDPLDPRSFADGFSVIEDVRDNIEDYKLMTSRRQKNDYEVAAFNLSSAPSTLLDSLNQLRTRVWPDGDSAPLYPVALSVLKRGCEVLREHEVVVGLKKAQQDLDRTNFPTRHHRRVAYESAEAAYGDLPAAEKKRRWQLRMPQEMLEDVQALAGALAISAQAAVVLSMLVTLSVEPEELEDARREYSETVAAFLARAQVRSWVINSLVKGVGR